jgi:ribosomal RNA-processing protein 12
MRQAFASILQLCLDPRPKVRKKAAEVVKDALATPPPPMVYHPYAERVSEWVKSALEAINKMPVSRAKAGKPEAPGAESAIHIIAFLRSILKSLPPSVSSFISSLGSASYNSYSLMPT